MKNTAPYLGFLLLIVAMACEEKDPTFVIAEDHIGKLSKNTLVSDLEGVFQGDSLVHDTTSSRLGSQAQKIKVFENGGALLLTLTPTTDSLPIVDHVAVADARFQTEAGIGTTSTFKDIRTQYEIKKIVTTMNSVVVFPKESALYFTIDKDQLPDNLRFTMANIEAVQIPDDASIKYLMLGWDQ
ncbi:MAG: hypothetical protein AAGF77_08905 [Bacteroidota bacterium]